MGPKRSAFRLFILFTEKLLPLNEKRKIKIGNFFSYVITYARYYNEIYIPAFQSG